MWRKRPCSILRTSIVWTDRAAKSLAPIRLVSRAMIKWYSSSDDELSATPDETAEFRSAPLSVPFYNVCWD